MRSMWRIGHGLNLTVETGNGGGGAQINGGITTHASSATGYGISTRRKLMLLNFKGSI